MSRVIASRHASGAKSRHRAPVQIRPLEATDLPACAGVSAAAFGVDLSLPGARERWLARVGHLLRTDPGGCYVAERDGRVVGVAQAMVREGLWVLSLLAVDPRGQNGGAGRLLMERALAYGEERVGGLIVSSNDPRALRLYARSGFALRPTFQADGELDRRWLPTSAARVREGGEADAEELTELARKVRGAPYTSELRYLMSVGAKLLVAGDAGFALAYPGQGVWGLTARDEETAAALLWSALERSAADGYPTRVRWFDANQQWAIDVVLRAGLSLEAYGALCVRGQTGRLSPFIPTGSFA